MAKRKTQENKRKTQARQRIARTEAYSDAVRREYADAVNEILKLKTSVPKLDTGVMYSFAGDTKKIQKQVENILRKLYSATMATIQAGVRAEWNTANDETDELITSVVGKKAVSNPELAAWFDRNTQAMNAFINRTQNGFNLSSRIWQNTQQLRDEMEVAITVSIGEGQSAAEMSRKVRRYLNDPDLMFRRFRYKDEDGEWRKKWKKRIQTDEGRYRWIDYDRDSYKTGQGVYKSSYKNAMRVTRTETNMAYRNADHERWMQEDFVLGQRIETSNSHPKEDICDELAGEYPKDFVFEGWHPQCFCICTPILRPEEEMRAQMEAALRGEEYVGKEKPITTYPKGFQKFLDDNKEKILEAQERGTAPYFIRDNKKVVERRFNGEDLTDGTIEKQVENKNMQNTAGPQTSSMPKELEAKSNYLMGENYTFDKKFFDLLDPQKPIKLEIVTNGNSYSSMSGDLVHISTQRGVDSAWEKKAVVYHEYGHCIDAQKTLWKDSELIKIRNKQIKWLRSPCNKTLYDKIWVEHQGWVMGKKSYPSQAAYIDRRLELLDEKISNMKNETFVKRGITKADVMEQIAATRDAIKSLLPQYGKGHDTSYFKRPRMKETEYLAHAFENTYLGNTIFQKYLPDIYNEMIGYITAL